MGPIAHTALMIVRRLSLALLVVAVAGCANSPEAQKAAQARADAAENCTVTGSRLVKADCRDPSVRQVSREAFERAQSSQTMPQPAN
jgi:hypothetical protein